jgi:uncharacterized protein YbjT (DUF2867 family)
MHRTALLAGATGLVGRELLSLLLDDSDVAEVVALTRRPLATPHPKLQQGIVAFDQLASFALPPVDDFYCCLGTTIKQAGSQPAFREVDLIYPVTIARMALAAGASLCQDEPPFIVRNKTNFPSTGSPNTKPRSRSQKAIASKNP